jgi:hypothetical protein
MSDRRCDANKYCRHARTIVQDDEDEWDMELYEDLILPRLATNLFRNRLVAVQETTRPTL